MDPHNMDGIADHFADLRASLFGSVQQLRTGRQTLGGRVARIFPKPHEDRDHPCRHDGAEKTGKKYESAHQ
jgi:hypothetical protein